MKVVLTTSTVPTPLPLTTHGHLTAFCIIFCHSPLGFIDIYSHASILHDILPLIKTDHMLKDNSKIPIFTSSNKGLLIKKMELLSIFQDGYQNNLKKA